MHLGVPTLQPQQDGDVNREPGDLTCALLDDQGSPTIHPPSSEVTALVDLVEIIELVIRALGPAPRRTIDLARKDRHCNREISAVFCSTALKLLLFSQYNCADEVALFVSQ